MTTYEHALLGATGAIASGLHRRYGWPVVGMAAVTAVLPDWDGLSILFGADMFDRVHRVIGHNLLVCVLLGAAFAAADYRWAMILRAKQWIGRRIQIFAMEDNLPRRSAIDARDLGIWILVGVVASLSHLGVDLVYSGHATYSDWGLTLFWPFSDRAFVYPMVPWGDIGAAMILSVGMFAMLARPLQVRPIAWMTLVAVLVYIVGRGIVGI